MVIQIVPDDTKLYQIGVPGASWIVPFKECNRVTQIVPDGVVLDGAMQRAELYTNLPDCIRLTQIAPDWRPD